MSRLNRYLLLLTGWIALFILPMFAGVWYDSHYHVYQSLVSLAVIGMARKLYPTAWWADFLGVVAMLQIIHAVADFMEPGSPETYNWIQATFNGMELAFLALGAFSEWLHGRCDAVGNSRPRSDSDNGNQQRKSHA